VYVAVPTGDCKEYAILYMLASLRNIDYPSDKLKLNFAVTHLGNKSSEQFLARLRKLVSASNFQSDIAIHVTYPTLKDMERWGPYYAIIMNLHLMRLDFLDSDFEYFWLLGGDNPPPRDTLKDLFKLKADVASAVINQRHAKIKKWDMDENLVYPVYWTYLWTLEDLEPLNLEPELKEVLRTAWREFCFLDTTPPEGVRVLHNVLFGSGCSLIKKHVLEYLGYVLGSGGTHSEDLHFCNLANLRGYDTALSLDVRCMHFDNNGKVY